MSKEMDSIIVTTMSY